MSDLMNRLYTMATEIRSLTDPSLPLLGPACTVKVYPGDNLMVHKSLDVAQPGDVIVVDTSGSPDGRARRPRLDEGAPPRDRGLRRRRDGP